MAFSEVDFNRMQDQLIDLREVSYKKEERCKKQEKEITSLKERMWNTEKDLHKANQTINKSKKAKDYDILSQELDRMRMKRDVQEEESRIQNDELIKQLTEFVTANERLVEENDRLKEKKDMVAVDEYNELQGQLRRLHAQYAALQKCSQITQSTHGDISYITCSESDLHDGASQENNNNSNINDLVISNSNNNHQSDENSKTHHDNNDDDDVDNLNKRHLLENSNNNDNSMTGLRLRLETEKEENAMLKMQLSQATSKQKEELEKTKSELEKVEEKLKKKQESYLSLQVAKDCLLKEMNDRAAENAASSQWESKREQLTKEHKRMEASFITLNKKNQYAEKEKLLLENRVKALEGELKGRKEESVEDVGGKMEQKQRLIDEQMNLIEDMKAQVRESQSVHEKAVEEISVLRKQYQQVSNKFNEVNKVAESRKQHLDTMAIKYNEVIDSSKDRLQQLTLTNQQRAEKYDLEIEALKVEVKEFKGVKAECVLLKRQLDVMRVEKEGVEEGLKMLQNEKETNEASYKEELLTTTTKYQQEMNEQRQEHNAKIKMYEDRMSENDSTTETLKDSLSQKESIIKDHGEDKKLHEKRGSTVIKDLKKQLNGERRRSEKLQEKLQQVCDTKHRQSVEDLFRPCDLRARPNDNGSLSSLSPSGMSRDTYQGADEESEANLKYENEELIKRVTHLQQDVCMHKEKVSHLEASNASMAEDLLDKTAIIKHYHMQNKAGQLSSNNTSHNHDNLLFKRVMNLVTDNDKEGMNKKLQRIIEETLTKNMHLQNDVELLTKELAMFKVSNV